MTKGGFGIVSAASQRMARVLGAAFVGRDGRQRAGALCHHTLGAIAERLTDQAAAMEERAIAERHADLWIGAATLRAAANDIADAASRARVGGAVA